jgi:hypothetical protein
MSLFVRQRTGRVAAERCAAAVLGLASLLIGCAERPDGAYDASNYEINLESTGPDSDGGAIVEVEASIPIGGGVGGNAGGIAAGTAGGMAGGQAGGQAGGTEGGSAGSAGGSAGGAGGSGGTTGGMISPEQARLEKLTGHYYMRMDMHSTASATTALGAVRTTNITSHLLVTQLYMQDGQLSGVEQLCYQTFKHRCDANCSRLATTMRNEVKNELLRLQPARSYEVSEGGLSLRGEPQTLYLGFDATSNQALPSNASDARVWLNGSANNVREGMWLYLDSASSTGFITLTCEVYTAQKFVSAFDGTLKGTEQAPTLDGVSAMLNTDGTEGRTLGASKPDCEDNGAGATPTAGVQTVRFARANVVAGEASESAFWSCPAASTWDGVLPAPPL